MANLRIAVVGSGPSGFYATEALLRCGLSIAVDMFERLPVPYGLVRFGVAPDHPKLKQVTAVFERIAAMRGFRYVGGVDVGREVSIETLRSCYHAVVLATGADVGRRMNIPGETLPGCHQAGDFVAWYNGHPEFRDQVLDLSGERAVIVGHGNVALDVARILVKTPDELRHTDIAAHALEAIAGSRIREVQIVGRRSLDETRFSAKELEEFLELADCDPAIEIDDFPEGRLDAPAGDDAEGQTAAAIIARFAQRPSAKRKRCVFRFGLDPQAIHGTTRAERMLFSRRAGASGAGRGAAVAIDCSLVIASIGRLTAPLAQVPYDERRGVHENVAGRVILDGVPVPGLYACGWSKRGANGTIGTNRACGVETVEAVLADLARGGEPPPSDPDLLIEHLSQCLATLDFTAWQRINAEEIRLGQSEGKPRQKLTSIERMIAAAKIVEAQEMPDGDATVAADDVID